MTVRAYLRASTADQNASRAKEDLTAWAAAKGAHIDTYYVENASGATVDRDELRRLLAEAKRGDVLLVEAIDRLTRLKLEDWKELRDEIKSKGVVVVAKWLDSTHARLTQTQSARRDWIADAAHEMVNDLMIEIAAAKAREDYEMRRARAAQGVADRQARDARGETTQKGYAGRKADADMHRRIVDLKQRGMTYTQIADTLKTTRPTIARALRAAGLLHDSTTADTSR